MKYLIGIDGGGTATKICISDMDGQVVMRHRAGALNINGQNREAFQKTLSEILETPGRMELSAAECAGSGIGAAGVSNPQTYTLLKDAFQEKGYLAPLYAYSDGETALAAAFPDCPGIILIAGTGSICQGRTEDGAMVRAGGYGNLIDDGGSAYAIAIGILSAVVRGEDGRGVKTILRDRVFEQWDIDGIGELIGYLYQPGRTKKEIASLAVLLGEAVAAGDEAALAIERTCVDELSQMVLTVMKKLPKEKNVAFSGSVLLKNERIQSRVRDRIIGTRRDACVLLADQDASEGAVKLLMRELRRHTV